MQRTWKELEKALQECGFLKIEECTVACDPDGGYQLGLGDSPLRKFASLQEAAETAGLSAVDFSRALDAPPVNVLDREKDINLACAALIHTVPKDLRAKLNGPLRALFGAYNRLARTRALEDGVVLCSVDDLKAKVSNDLGNALGGADPLDYVSNRVLSVRTENAARKQVWNRDQMLKPAEVADA